MRSYQEKVFQAEDFRLRVESKHDFVELKKILVGLRDENYMIISQYNSLWAK